MQTVEYASLGDQVSHKISMWILVFVTAVIVVVLSVSLFLSRQMFNSQVDSWNRIVPHQMLTQLMDSDHFSVGREMQFLKSTGLFSSAVVMDNEKKVIAQFGEEISHDINLIPMRDNAAVIWGYYYFHPDFYRFSSPFLIAAGFFFLLIFLVYGVVRWRIGVTLASEFSRFNHFLQEIENVTQRLHQIYESSSGGQIDLKSSQNSEQVIINRAIARLLEEIRKANHSLREVICLAEQRRFQEELTHTALQVVHDIGSPIAVLEIVQSTALTLPEETRLLIRDAITRIRAISQTLLKKAKQDFLSNRDDVVVQQMLLILVEQVVNEKRVQYGNLAQINFVAETNAHNLFAFVKPSELSRILSNLINNSVEAIESNRCITVSLCELDKKVCIKIQDYGKGISDDILNKLGVLGGSFGKSGGTGIGLHHALSMMKQWDGMLKIESEEGAGTTVQLFFPKCQNPSWFVPEISICDGQVVVIADDDPSIHAVWNGKFAQFKCQTDIMVDLVHVYSPDELTVWKNKFSLNHGVLYFCDFEFIGSDKNGIEVITELNINDQAILVTSHSVEEVVSLCEAENIRLLPKSIASVVPLVPISRAAVM